MARNGSGTFVRAHDFTDDAAAAIKIRADRMDEEIDGIATALSASIANDGQTTILTDLPMSTFKHTGVGNATARNQYCTVAGLQDGSHNWVAAGGTADAITATYAPALTALVDGQLCFVRAGAANATTTPTFAPNGLTAHTITKQGGAALVAGDIKGSLAEITLRYNLANTRWELLNPAKPYGATTGSGSVVLAGSPTLNGTVNFLASLGGANVGNITNDGSGLYISSASSDFHLGANGTYVSIGSAGGFVPVIDNTMSCGTAAQRWAIVYATNGTINTSDERYKEWPSVPQTDYRQKIKDLWVGDYFRFDDIAHTKGRVHELGIRAQQADEVLDGLMIERPADETGIWGVKSHMPGNLALWGVKDLYALVEMLADRIAVLEAKEKAE